MRRVLVVLLAVALIGGAYRLFQGDGEPMPNPGEAAVAAAGPSGDEARAPADSPSGNRPEGGQDAPIWIEVGPRRQPAARAERLAPDFVLAVESPNDPDAPPAELSAKEARRTLELLQDDLSMFSREQDGRILELRRGGGDMVDGEAVFDEDFVTEDALERMQFLRDTINAERERIAIKRQDISAYQRAFEWAGGR